MILLFQQSLGTKLKNYTKIQPLSISGVLAFPNRMILFLWVKIPDLIFTLKTIFILIASPSQKLFFLFSIQCGFFQLTIKTAKNQVLPLLIFLCDKKGYSEKLLI